MKAFHTTKTFYLGVVGCVMIKRIDSGKGFVFFISDCQIGLIQYKINNKKQIKILTKCLLTKKLWFQVH